MKFFSRLLLLSMLLGAPAWAQNPVAPTPPFGDNSNRVATTAFVQAALSGTSGLLHSANFWTALNTFNLSGGTLPTAAWNGIALQVGGVNGANARILLQAFGGIPLLTCARANGTVAALTAIAADNQICAQSGWGYDGSAYGIGAAFNQFAAQNWTVGAHGSYAEVQTILNGTTALATAMRWENDGGTTVPNTVSGGSKGLGTINATQLYVAGTAVPSVLNPLSQFAATTSAQLAGVISNETGTGVLVFNTSPTLVTPVLGVASASSVDFSSATPPANGIYLPSANTLGLSARSLPALQLTNPASAVNFIAISGEATGLAPSIVGAGTDTNISMQIATKGTGFLSFNTGGGRQLQVIDTASVVNNLQFTGSPSAAGNLNIIAAGTDSNLNITLVPKGTSLVVNTSGFLTNGNTAIPAGGNGIVGYRATSTNTFGIYFGSGVPTLSAAKGSLYLRSDGSTTNDRAYINTNGSTTWTPLTTGI